MERETPQTLRITLKKSGNPTDATAVPAAPLTTPHHLFKGPEDSPLLAPRGVHLVGDKMIVADTGQNRVFVWDDFPALYENKLTHRPATVVLGQVDGLATGRNAGQGVTASSLQYPSGVWSDGERLIIADAWNHRVLIWHRFPTTNGQPADVILGQPNPQLNQPNVSGIGATPSERSMNWPYGVTSDGKSLWVADTGNRRVLYFAEIPSQDFTEADGVIGKADFTDRDYDHHDPIWPYSVKLGPQGQLLVTDTQYYRCLLWHDRERAFGARADVIIGQPDFAANGMNQYDLSPRADTLNWCYDAGFQGDGLWVADTGNSRVLWFDQVPTANGARATNLLGKPHFRVGSENSATVFGTEAQLYWPFSLSTQGEWLALADTGNHRVTLQKLIH